MFKAEMNVRIKDNFTVKGDCDENALRTFKRYRGMETVVQCIYNQCCTLQIDHGHWAWSYDWLEPVYDHLESELFEI
jgi:hypothetical protein